MKELPIPTVDMLEKSVKNNIRYYQIFLVIWLAGIGYYAYSRDSYWLIYGIFFFVAAVNFNICQKIDKARLEIIRK